jgi:hypothetical protein
MDSLARAYTHAPFAVARRGCAGDGWLAGAQPGGTQPERSPVRNPPPRSRQSARTCAKCTTSPERRARPHVHALSQRGTRPGRADISGSDPNYLITARSSHGRHRADWAQVSWAAVKPHLAAGAW